MAKTASKAGGKLHTQVGAFRYSAPVKHKLVIKGLGFTRLNQIIERPDTAAIRGMVAKVPHLVEFVESSKLAGETRVEGQLRS